MNNNELRCYKHHDRVMYDVCSKCKKFLCKECAQKYPSGLCDECEKKRIKQMPIEKEKAEKERKIEKNNAIIRDVCIIPPCMIIGFLASFILIKDISLAFVSTGIIIGYLFAGWIIGFEQVKKDIYINYNLKPKDYSDVALYNMFSKEIFEQQKGIFGIAREGILEVSHRGRFVEQRVNNQLTEIFICIFIGFFLGIILIPIRLIQWLTVLFKKNK